MGGMVHEMAVDATELKRICTIVLIADALSINSPEEYSLKKVTGRERTLMQTAGEMATSVFISILVTASEAHILTIDVATKTHRNMIEIDIKSVKSSLGITTEKIC